LRAADRYTYRVGIVEALLASAGSIPLCTEIEDTQIQDSTLLDGDTIVVRAPSSEPREDRGGQMPSPTVTVAVAASARRASDPQWEERRSKIPSATILRRRKDL
jgi:hypothetical protein